MVAGVLMVAEPSRERILPRWTDPVRMHAVGLPSPLCITDCANEYLCRSLMRLGCANHSPSMYTRMGQSLHRSQILISKTSSVRILTFSLVQSSAISNCAVRSTLIRRNTVISANIPISCGRLRRCANPAFLNLSSFSTNRQSSNSTTTTSSASSLLSNRSTQALPKTTTTPFSASASPPS